MADAAALHTREVAGSILAAPTWKAPGNGDFAVQGGDGGPLLEAFWKRPRGNYASSAVANPNPVPNPQNLALRPDQPNYVHGVYSSRRELPQRRWTTNTRPPSRPSSRTPKSIAR